MLLLVLVVLSPGLRAFVSDLWIVGYPHVVLDPGLLPLHLPRGGTELERHRLPEGDQVNTVTARLCCHYTVIVYNTAIGTTKSKCDGRYCLCYWLKYCAWY